MATSVRLQRYLAAAGVAARRKAEDLITAGRVTVNGAVVTTLGTKVDPAQDQITVDGEAVVPLDHFYVVFNKPKACITAVTDDRGRMTVMDYLPNLPVPVKPVGRLDFYTEGVLLLTNDGELAARLLAPGNHVPKTYHVKVHGRVKPEHVKGLRSGVQLDDGTVTMPAEVETLPAESKHTWLGITIHEGKHRQIHRMLEALGYRVDKLQRVAFANLTFHHLRVGDARELSQQELNELRDLVGLDHSAVSRGKWRVKREATDIPRRARAKALAEAAEGEPGRDDREDTWSWSDTRTKDGDKPGKPGLAGTPGRGAPAPARGRGGGRTEDRRTDTRRTGRDDGRNDGRNAGRNVGPNVGRNDGRNAGPNVGPNVGRNDGRNAGRNVGPNVGRNDGRNAGRNVGPNVGRNDGRNRDAGRSSSTASADNRRGQGRTFGKRAEPRAGGAGASRGRSFGKRTPRR